MNYLTYFKAVNETRQTQQTQQTQQTWLKPSHSLGRPPVANGGVEMPAKSQHPVTLTILSK